MQTLSTKLRKAGRWLSENILTVGLGLFLVFIPLYPKLPLIDVKHTWVYIRLEDFLVAILTLYWLWGLWRRRYRLRIPLGRMIILYWLVGGLSLLFSLVFISRHLANFFPNVALLHYLRRLEYMVVFFLAFAAVGSKKTLRNLMLVSGITVILVSLYGYGQKFLGWPAYLTMNEEFSKGMALRLPATGRIASTFAGHYDLAAWLVLMIPLAASLLWGYRKKVLKIISLLAVVSGFVLLLYTASRVSFACYLAGISLVLWLQRQRWLIVPVLVVSILAMGMITGASERFGKTLRVEDVIYDAKTGKPVGTLQDESKIGQVITEEQEVAEEDLPLGTGYIDLPVTSPPEATQVAVIKRSVIKDLKMAEKASEIATVSGEFLVRRALVYDISFTTRFQGTWPRAIEAFRRNPLLGSGYSAAGLASDSSYLRSLGETGLLGFASFFSIFFGFFIFASQSLVKVKDKLVRSVLIGLVGGLFGLLLNAVLIDVFEASKLALYLWAMLGLGVGAVGLELKTDPNLLKRSLEILKQPLVLAGVLVLASFFVYLSPLKNYFTGDDFTWLRWASTSTTADLGSFFVQAEGFFYRPLAKVYFTLVFPFAGLRPGVYHFVSYGLHLLTVLTLFLLANRLTGQKTVAFLAALLFLFHPANAEPVFWISSTSILMANLFSLLSLTAYYLWSQLKRRWALVFLFFSFLFFLMALASHELAVALPLLIIWYDLVYTNAKSLKEKAALLLKKRLVIYLAFGSVLAGYLFLRNQVAGAHGLSGDYNYNLAELPFNFAGNLFGYLGLTLIGLPFFDFYEQARLVLRQQKELALLIVFGAGLFGLGLVKKSRKLLLSREFIFFSGWGVIGLLPFLGLGNIAERYLYLAKYPFIFLLVWFGRKWQRSFKRKKMAAFVFLLIYLAYFVFNLNQLQQTKRDWFKAGEIANMILLTVGTNHSEFPAGSNLFFVNVPVRLGRAWVFPVGLKDGLWFIYPNIDLNISRSSDLQATLDAAEPVAYPHVFFYQEGELKRVSRE